MAENKTREFIKAVKNGDDEEARRTLKEVLKTLVIKRIKKTTED